MNTVSLDLAKRLHAIGYRGETEKIYTGGLLHEIVCGPLPEGDDVFSAPTATELLRDMPAEIRDGEFLKLSKYSDKIYGAGYWYYDALMDSEKETTPAEALGKLYLSLHEKGIIK